MAEEHFMFRRAKNERITVIGLAARWNRSRRTIERKIQKGEIPQPSSFLGHREWRLEAIKAFERQHFGKELE